MSTQSQASTGLVLAAVADTNAVPWFRSLDDMLAHAESAKHVRV